MLTLSAHGARVAKIALVSLLGVLVVPLPAAAMTVNLSYLESSESIGGALFLQFDPFSATGTGLIDSFVRVQANGQECGYNTDGPLEFDTKGGYFTHSLLLCDVPVAEYEGGEYREFLLDINEGGGNNSLVSLDELKIHLESAGDLSGYPASFSAPVYDLDEGGDNWIVLDAGLESGSGGGDVLVLIPNDLFGTDETKFVYLYSKFGLNVRSGGGFEEWAVAIGDPFIPEPTTLLLFCALSSALLRLRTRPRR